MVGLNLIYQLALKLNFWIFRADLTADFKPVGLWA
nr:MAG TPA: hypothetical protein [Caudoviricetes sp.]